jgi:hypothetical protein
MRLADGFLLLSDAHGPGACRNLSATPSTGSPPVGDAIYIVYQGQWHS